MLEKNAEIRPSVRELLADPYVQAGYVSLDMADEGHLKWTFWLKTILNTRLKK